MFLDKFRNKVKVGNKND